MPNDRRLSPTSFEGLKDPETGELWSFTPSDSLWVTRRVAMHRDELCFDWDAGPMSLKAPLTLLERFLRIRSDEAFLNFARKFGPLAPRGLYGGDQATSSNSSEHREPLDLWRKRQREFNAVLALVASVREKQSPQKTTFAELHELGVLRGVFSQLAHSENGEPPPILQHWESISLADRLTTARHVFLRQIQVYVRHCGLRPALSLEMNRLGVRFALVFQDARADFVGAGLSLLGALTVQLMSAATGSALAICSACNDFFVPRRRLPAFGKRRYCSRCGRAAAVRDAKKDYRSRLRTKDAARRRPI